MLAGLPQHVRVSWRAHPVEDDAGDSGGFVECREPVQQRGHAVTLAAGVDDEDHRRSEQGGHVRGRSRRRPRHGAVDASVEQAHDALDDGDVAAVAAVPVERRDQLLADQHRVQVAARPVSSQRVIARVDVVRPHLERCHAVAGLSQGADQSRCHRGFSAARCRRCDHDGGDATHPISRERACLHTTRRKNLELCARSRRLMLTCATGRSEDERAQTVQIWRRVACRHAPSRLLAVGVTIRCLFGPCGRRPSDA